MSSFLPNQQKQGGIVAVRGGEKQGYFGLMIDV
jgi:hypothetical protein